MKTLFALATVLVMFLTVGPIPAEAQVTCDGVDVDDVLTDEQFVLCWTKNHANDQVVGYKVYKSLVSNQKGDLFLTFLTTDCGTDLCETGPLVVAVPGTHYLKVYAYDEGRVVNFQRYDPATQQMKDETYTMAAAESEASPEVVLIVNESGAVVPNPPSGWSVKKFLP